MPRRVASLLPSATEIVCLVGARDQLVGVSHECDFPPEVAGLPVLTRSRVALPQASADIDRSIREVLRDALTVYEVLVDELERARPDVIVTQDLCDVCAVSLDDVRSALGELGREAELVNLHPTRFGDLFTDVRRVARALGAEARAESELARLAERVEAVRARAAGSAERPAVLTIEWLAPVMIGGTWMPELVELAGGRALVTKPGEHAPTLERAALRALDPAPEVVLVKPCGFPLERTFSEERALHDLLDDLDWPAIRAGRVHVADGSAYFNRPGPRLVDSLEILAACTHPAEFADLARRHSGAFVTLPAR